MVRRIQPRRPSVLTASEDATARYWSLPAPFAGTADEARLWVEAATGMELDPEGGARTLDDAAWRSRPAPPPPPGR